MPEYPKKAVGDAISKALRGAKIGRRHPAEVTSDRLGDATAQWGDQFEPDELDMIAMIRHRLEEIAKSCNR